MTCTLSLQNDNEFDTPPNWIAGNPLHTIVHLHNLKESTIELSVDGSQMMHQLAKLTLLDYNAILSR